MASVIFVMGSPPFSGLVGRDCIFSINFYQVFVKII